MYGLAGGVAPLLLYPPSRSVPQYLQERVCELGRDVVDRLERLLEGLVGRELGKLEGRLIALDPGCGLAREEGLVGRYRHIFRRCCTQRNHPSIGAIVVLLQEGPARLLEVLHGVRNEEDVEAAWAADDRVVSVVRFFEKMRRENVLVDVGVCLHPLARVQVLVDEADGTMVRPG